MSLEDKEIAAVRPDVLTPAENAAKLETIGVNKVNMPLTRSIILGILAGMFIAMGGMMLALILGDATLPIAVRRIVGGLVFCIGLVLVLLSGAELFTGNNLIINATMSKKVKWSAYIKNLIIIWIANLVGSLIAVAIIYFSNFGALYPDNAIANTFISLAASKVALPPVTMFFKAILCNFLVCLAVWMSFSGRTFVDKFFAIIFPITAFVAAGGEHCVANMFLIPLGFVYNLAAGGAAAIDIAGIAYNLGLVTLGNMVGGIVFVGLFYWAAFRKKA
ncbi:MAG: formate/nitrite transporter family protein [Coriobacteriales bacterium]|jgi:formate/nitrite transporter|nr:formate/nitrite transporter family protein [Coriobacteriales bacterium]